MRTNERWARRVLVCSTAFLIGFVFAVPADAEVVICQKKKRIKLREDVCKNKETLVDPSELGVSVDVGNGPYGDGSAGALVIDDFRSLDDVVPDGNLQFTSVTINAGGTLVVPSGTVIRCSDSFVNDGVLSVETSARPGFLSLVGATNQVIPRSSAPDPTLASAAPGPGATVDGIGWEAGGGSGLFDRARFLLQPGRHGGSAGSLGPRGGNSGPGGSITILARLDLTNRGMIDADAMETSSSGAGGGGGGFVILASATQILHAATGAISARGGEGGASTDGTPATAAAYTVGPGGGGGGGCVHLLAPAVTNAGPVDVSAGGPGLSQTVTLRQLRSGGGGGGASCGTGGNGGRIIASTTPGDADPGTDGALFVTLTDPTAMF